MRWLLLSASLLVFFASSVQGAGPDGNRLTYLEENNPYYVSRDFPKLITPQWIGEEGVDAVVVLAVDDMRETRKYEEFLRPILIRLKQIDGRAPVSIMTCKADPKDEKLQQWLAEGLSIDVHTFDHPCPLLGDGDFAKAKSTYDRCVDLMNQIPGNKPVAFRMPCCDSLNTVSPRFYSEIFNRTTEAENHLSISSSVFNIFTSDDPDIPAELVIDADGRGKFLKYIPKGLVRKGAVFNTFVNTIRNYPYPYVINRSCWEFPCVAPSDWSAQHLQGENNPDTLRDWKAAIDITVLKQGVFCLVFHPHGWIRNDQVVELIDYVQNRYAKKVRFLTFREAADRLARNLLERASLRGQGTTQPGFRLVDLNHDGLMDVVKVNKDSLWSRVWDPNLKLWKKSNAYRLADTNPTAAKTLAAPRFAVLQVDGSASVLLRLGSKPHGCRFDGANWVADAALNALPQIGSDDSLLQKHGGRVAFRDLDADGRTECIVWNSGQCFMLEWVPAAGEWRRLPFSLPVGTQILTEHGRNAGIRFIDFNDDGFDDVVFSNQAQYGIWLFKDMKSGWSIEVVAGRRGARDTSEEIPAIVRADGSDNGFFFHSRHLFWQNEDTDGLPDLVDRRSFNELLKNVEPRAKSSRGALKSMRVRSGFQVELVAAEPLVMDPVAFDWAPDGKLWVVEMGDYPLGVGDQGKSGGRVRFLEDTDGDGQYDKSILFLDGLAYPNGIMLWRDGVLVSSAPDILYAEDTDGDGKADVTRVLFTGFGEGNQQHRVNGFAFGLDNWVHVANGDSGGGVKAVGTVSGKRLNAQTVGFRGRDLRIRPDQGLLDPQSGQTQFGRNRDDWGNWFGNSNSRPLFHFVLADHYLRRNPHIAVPPSWREVPQVPGAAPVFPVSPTLPRFNDHDRVNRFTSACSAIIYRDQLFGLHFDGNMFVCEPVHNLVHRQVLDTQGVTFTSHRAADEMDSEFLASTDNWFRPVFLRTGPDGALWIADMYRHVIEHPQWIPNEWQRRLDLRAGQDKGRIYRVIPVQGRQAESLSLRGPRFSRLHKLGVVGLVAALDSANGWQRDTVQRLLVHKRDDLAVKPLKSMVRQSHRPATRLHALCTLEGLDELDTQILMHALADEHPAVRRHAIRLSEPFFDDSRQLVTLVLRTIDDTDLHVQLQLAYSLGELGDARVGSVLGRLAARHHAAPYLLAAVLSSVNRSNVGSMLRQVLALDAKAIPPATLVGRLLGLAASFHADHTLIGVLRSVSAPREQRHRVWQMQVVASMLESLQRRRTSIKKLLDDPDTTTLQQIAELIAAAVDMASNPHVSESDRLLAIRLLGLSSQRTNERVGCLKRLLVPQQSSNIQTAAVTALARIGSEAVPDVLLDDWKSHGPSLRSQILEILLSRPVWSSVLLAHVDSRRVLPAEIDAARRQRLLDHRDAALRSQALRLLGGGVNSQRRKVVDSYRGALSLTPNVSGGADVFKKRCSACHKLQGVGKEIGPDLVGLKDKSPGSLLTAILDPNKAVEAKFINFTALSADGRTYSGMLVSESGNSITLADAEGKQTTLLRSELESLVSSNKSFMPDGMEKDLSLQDVADVISFVTASGPIPKKFLGNQPAIVKPAADLSLTFSAANAEIHGPSIVFESTYQNIGFWRREADRAIWPVTTTVSGRFSVILEYACTDSTAGNRFLFEIAGKKLSESVVGTGGWERYRKTIVGEIDIPAGRHQATFHSNGRISGYMLDLKQIRLVPVKGNFGTGQAGPGNND